MSNSKPSNGAPVAGCVLCLPLLLVMLIFALTLLNSMWDWYWLNADGGIGWKHPEPGQHVYYEPPTLYQVTKVHLRDLRDTFKHLF